MITDHQEDVTKMKAIGGSTKKAWSDLYLKVTREGDDEWKPGRIYHLTIENLKQSRMWLPRYRGRVIGGKGADGNVAELYITWEAL